MPTVQTISFKKRHLPHWTVADRSYFVTFRLKGSLPPEVVAELEAERRELCKGDPSVEELGEFHRQRFLRIDAILDAAKEKTVSLVEDDKVAKLVFDAFSWLEQEKGWLVHAATVMPSHVHLLLRHSSGDNGELTNHLGVLKGYTAREVNKLLGRTGLPLWEDENFDHWCRNEGKRQGAAEYIAMNPVKAGLVARWQDWPWTRVVGELVELMR